MTQIKLNHHCGIFVTLNPAGADYGGRQKLPGNIQALFRPIVMQQPEPKEIARVMLFVEGFKQATEIAERAVELFDMCGKILTHQRHYDWGLRELKTILLACGEGLRENLKITRTSAAQKTITSTTTAVTTTTIANQHNVNDNIVIVHNDDNYNNGEMSVVVQCLRTSLMSKLALHDVARFDMLLQNVFPEIKINDKFITSQLQQSISEAFGSLGLCVNEMQIIKCLQLYEQLQKRMGVVVMGPPGCGKSTIISLLRQALITQTSMSSSTTATTVTTATTASTNAAVVTSSVRQYSQLTVSATPTTATATTMPTTSSTMLQQQQQQQQQIRIHTISPKSMSRVQLLGRLDPDTRQWLDGVLTHIAAAVNAEPPHIHSWIVCDGSIDPEWIEALNSVLDDNK